METWMQACKSTPVTRSASTRFKLHFNLFVFNFNNLSRIVLRCPCVTTITIKSDHESLLLFYAPHEHQISTWTWNGWELDNNFHSLFLLIDGFHYSFFTILPFLSKSTPSTCVTNEHWHSFYYFYLPSMIL